MLKHFKDAPETGESGDREQGLPEEVGDGQRGGPGYDAPQEEGPPAAHAEVVFTFDYERVADADYQEAAQAEEQARQVVLGEELCHCLLMGNVVMTTG